MSWLGCSLGLLARAQAGLWFFFFQAEDGIRDVAVTGVQTCALPISPRRSGYARGPRRGRRAPAQIPHELNGAARQPASCRVLRCAEIAPTLSNAGERQS